MEKIMLLIFSIFLLSSPNAFTMDQNPIYPTKKDFLKKCKEYYTSDIFKKQINLFIDAYKNCIKFQESIKNGSCPE